MKRIFLFGVILAFMACEESKNTTTENTISEDRELAYFGDTISVSGAIQAENLMDEMKGESAMKTKVSGVVTDVCQAKGCWMKVDLGDGETMRVTFKDYGFFVPKDAAGKTVIFEGVAEKTVVDVETQRHYAADAGKSDAEIEAIQEPSEELTFVAEGVALATDSGK